MYVFRNNQNALLLSQTVDKCISFKQKYECFLLFPISKNSLVGVGTNSTIFKFPWYYQRLMVHVKPV